MSAKMDSVRKESHVVSVMIPRLETDAVRDTFSYSCFKRSS